MTDWNALRHGCFVAGALLTAALPPVRADEPLRFEMAPHRYWEQSPQDPFSQWWRHRGAAPLAPITASDEKGVVKQLLAALAIPETSQMLVFSATSLQRSISPSHPRALYFNDEMYLGWVPDGRVEVAADDPELGPVFFILSVGGGRTGEPERQTRCLNCHGSADVNHLPTLLSQSVLPDRAGGSLERYRELDMGHHVPLAQRFGGWHITDAPASVVPHANQLGAYANGRLTTEPNPAGQRFALDQYLQPASALLPQLIHEHQLGAVNRLTTARYRTRELTAPEHGPLTAADTAELDTMARGLARYFLFSDEATLPGSGIAAVPEFARDFQKNRRPDARNRSLKDLDGRTRLFTHRCSYMIYSALWRGLPAIIKDRTWLALGRALAPADSADGQHLSPEEKLAIREIVAATCDDRPPWWR